MRSRSLACNKWTAYLFGIALVAPGCSAEVSSPASCAPSCDVSAVIPAQRRTLWQPGIPGGVPARTTICTTIDAATYGNGATDATSAIQAALNGCGANQVVYLPPGRYATSAPLTIPSDVVLRGAGPSQTRIEDSAAGAAIFFGGWGSYGVVTNLVGSVAKGATSITVESAGGLTQGDVIQIDQLDDPAYVVRGDATWYKRNDGGYRSMGQSVEIASVDGNVLGLASPLHSDFDAAFRPQVVRTTAYRNIGLEDLTLWGGNNRVVNAFHNAYSWIKNIEIDGSTMAADGGPLVAFGYSYRCVVRDSYFHHHRTYVNGSGSYGVSLQAQTSDSLVENNIIYFMNKPFMFEASGGGNVVAYNYMDDAQITGNAWQETDIDTHASFPHHELVEGNYAPHIATDNTHGGSGWFTFFRNYSSGQHRSVTFGGVAQTQNRTGLEVAYGNYYANSVGNAFLYPGVSGAVYAADYVDHPASPVNTIIGQRIGFLTGAETWEAMPAETLLSHGNFDYATGSVHWDPAIASRSLPASLYLTEKPAFFGAEPWPYVDPTRDPVVGTLPAKQRFDALP